MTAQDFAPDHVLDLWFPDTGFWESQDRFSNWIFTRMQGGMDEIICTQYADLTTAAAQGLLDHWAETPRGRLALLIALDQFPRSLWRDTPGAYAQDIKANRLVLDGVDNGDFHALAPWEQLFFLIALTHCEGPDHLDRLSLVDRLTEDLIAKLPAPLADMADRLRAQNALVRCVIERIGRHPHRNPIYGRVSTPEETAYIATGDFPHVKSTPDA